MPTCVRPAIFPCLLRFAEHLFFAVHHLSALAGPKLQTWRQQRHLAADRAVPLSQLVLYLSEELIPVSGSI